jgi:penicillin-binding protein 1A
MWMDFMRAAIANKPDEKFPEGNAPKKQLEVAEPAQGEAPEAKAPEAIPDEPDSTEPEPVPEPARSQ